MTLPQALFATWKSNALGLVCLAFLTWDAHRQHLGMVELYIDLSAPIVAFAIIVGIRMVVDRLLN